MDKAFPAFVVAGTASGVGKTSVALALVCALRARGLAVQPFKCGPDFLDPTHHSAAAGRPCHNLDGWMMGRANAENLFMRSCNGADAAVVEGVMGLFDSSAPGTLEGSTAEISMLTGAPVVLVVDARGMAGSVAAMVKGYCEFAPGLKIAGVLANNTGSPRHAELLSRALRAASLPPLLGAIPKGALPSLPSRHLGLVSAGGLMTDGARASFVLAAEENINVDLLLKLSRIERKSTAPLGRKTDAKTKIGIARDAAFHFYYQDNLDALEAAGAELVYFSPLGDAGLPGGLSGLYIGGGYPEEYARRLSENGGMLESIRNLVRDNRTVYAECGGLMYLSRGIETRDGVKHHMAGILPFWTRMLDRYKALGYVEAALLADSPLGGKGQIVRGHKFHYSEITDVEDADGWAHAYAVKSRDASPVPEEGFLRGPVFASYIHVHFASRAGTAEKFVSHFAGGMNARGNKGENSYETVDTRAV